MSDPYLINLKQTHFCSLPQFGILQISGEKAMRFLQGQLTCDLNQINTTHSLIGLHCHANGRIISNGRLILFKDQCYIALLNDLLPTAQQALNKYALFSQVDINNDTAAWAHVGLLGENAPLELTDRLPHLPTQRNAVTTYSDIVAVCVDEQVPRWHIMGLSDAIHNLTQYLHAIATPLSLDHWYTLDIQQGMLWITPEISEQFTPHALSFQHTDAMSFNKGCYTGQEIISRMHYRAQLKKALYHAHMETGEIPPLNAPLHEQDSEKVIGHIVAAHKNPEHGIDLLVCLSIANAQNNTAHYEGMAVDVIDACV